MCCRPAPWLSLASDGPLLVAAQPCFFSSSAVHNSIPNWRGPAASLGPEVPTRMRIHLAGFPKPPDFKAVFFSLWLLLQNNLKTDSLSFCLSQGQTFPSICVEHLHQGGKGCVWLFLSRLCDFFLFGPQRALQERRDRIVLFFFFLNLLNIHQVMDSTSTISQGNKNSLQPAFRHT